MASENEKYPGYSLEENFKKTLTEMLVLSLLAEQDRYIGELTTTISQRSRNVLNIVFPYGAVYRLEESGYIREIDKRVAPDGRRRQYLGITDAGKKRLQDLQATYKRLCNGVERVLEG
jgi:DNA-binding PadR family transcriptional regulator